MTAAADGVIAYISQRSSDDPSMIGRIVVQKEASVFSPSLTSPRPLDRHFADRAVCGRNVSYPAAALNPFGQFYRRRTQECGRLHVPEANCDC
jgi:hypothetical protein